METEVAEITGLIFDRFGYDFRGYRHRPMESRLRYLCVRLGLPDLAGLKDWLTANPDSIGFVVDNLTIPVSDFFREPETFAEVRTQLFARLSTLSSITIWHAGCAGGQEVYSLAVLLAEAGLHSRTRIFASDISPDRLRLAREGAEIPLDRIEALEQRYLKSGGADGLFRHLRASGAGFRFNEALVSNVVFVQHNLATDGVFCEADLILCRNVLIYFGDELQLRAFDLFRDSLARGGYLCLGDSETPIGTAPGFVKLAGCSRIYRPVRAAGSPFAALA